MDDVVSFGEHFGECFGADHSIIVGDWGPDVTNYILQETHL